MQKLSAFYLANSKNELPYFSINKTVENLNEILYNANLYDDENLEEEFINEVEQNIFPIPEKEILNIEELLNLHADDFTKDLGDIIVDTFDVTDSDDNETISIQDNNSVEEDWDPEREADLILNEN
jgi:hypothetical protein